jgi:hypothetical protein
MPAQSSKKELLGTVRSDLESVSPVARIDLGEDVLLIEAQLARYERRTLFWSDRATALSAANGHKVNLSNLTPG